MTWFQRLRFRLTEWIFPSTVIALPLPKLAPRRRAKWTGLDSLTRQKILDALARGVPMTRIELNTAADTSTCGQLLPQMVSRGEVRVVPNTRPYRYEIPSVGIED